MSHETMNTDFPPEMPPQPTPPRSRRGSADGSPCPRQDAVPRFDVAGLMRRARRNAKLSQREMAELIGVGKSTVAQAERDYGYVSLPVLLATLAAGGIDLIAIDSDGEVDTMRLDELRDRRGRRLPAHLRAWVASERENVPTHWRGSTRRNAPVRWALRSQTLSDEPLPRLHPGPEDVTIVQQDDADKRDFRRICRQAWGRALADRAAPLPACTCSDECVTIGMACPPACPCQCEAPALEAG